MMSLDVNEDIPGGGHETLHLRSGRHEAEARRSMAPYEGDLIPGTYPVLVIDLSRH